MENHESIQKVHEFEEESINPPPEDIVKYAATTNFPTPLSSNAPVMSDAEKIEYITKKFSDIMWALGLDLSDGSLANTPRRVAKMFVNEIFSGLDVKNFPAISLFEDPHQQSHNNMVLVKSYFHSFCEHHFIPFDGEAYVAYIPKGKIIGLSKIPRIIRFFGQRPQVQERLGAQIADCLSILMEVEDVAVSLVMEHTCVAARGIADTRSHTITNILRGKFKDDPSVRGEFFEGINRKN